LLRRRPIDDPTHDLVSRARAGDTDALAALYERHARSLAQVVRRLLGTATEAEDTVQDVFASLPSALATYVEDGRFDAWLRRVVVRAALLRLRARRRRREIDLDATPPTGALAVVNRTAADRLIDRLELERAIATLPDKLRTVFVLREVEGYSHAEIAAALGISRQASEVRLFRAVRHLRRMLS
jgi:RNA polymerase sigma-70 factor (ECF subfamily)